MAREIWCGIPDTRKTGRNRPVDNEATLGYRCDLLPTLTCERNVKQTLIICDRADVYARTQVRKYNVSDYGDMEKAFMLVYTLVGS